MPQSIREVLLLVSQHWQTINMAVVRFVYSPWVFERAHAWQWWAQMKKWNSLIYCALDVPHLLMSQVGWNTLNRWLDLSLLLWCPKNDQYLIWNTLHDQLICYGCSWLHPIMLESLLLASAACSLTDFKKICLLALMAAEQESKSRFHMKNSYPPQVPFLTPKSALRIHTLLKLV